MSLAALFFFAGAALAAIGDIRSRKVTNRLNLVILSAGLGWRAGTLDGMTFLAGLAGVGVGLAVLFVPFAARWIGAGDLKLLMAIGAWLGPFDTLLAGLFGLFGGGVLAAAIAFGAGKAVRRSVAKTLAASILTLSSPAAPKRARALVVPLAVPLASAAIAIFMARGY